MSAGPHNHALRTLARWILAIFVVAAAFVFHEFRDARTRDSAQEESSATREGSGDFGGNEEDAYDENLQEQLEVLGYAELAPAEDGPVVTGVQIFDEERTQPGLNMYCSPGTGSIHFVTNSGELIHTVDFPSSSKKDRHCTTVVPTPDGDLVLQTWLTAITKFGLDGTLRWKNTGKYHHDLDILPDGSIYTLGLDSSMPNLFSEFAASENPTTNDDYIGLISPDGQDVTRLTSLAKAVSQEPALFASAKTQYLQKEKRGLARVKRAQKKATRKKSDRILKTFYRRISELFHTNTVHLLRNDVSLSNGDVWRKGFFLACIRNLDSVVVIDPDAERIVWSWGLGEMQNPHHPTLLENGNLLIFDNGTRRKASRVIELDPGSKKILWHYPEDSKQKLFSINRGSAFRLANGNTLITESAHGRAIEVTSEGEIIWEYLNRDVSDDGTTRRTLWRMTRLTMKQVATLNWPDEVRPRLIQAGFDL